MNRYNLTLKSKNVKTGPIPVSTTSADTCPTACPFREGGCYAKGGPLAIVWRNVETKGATLADFCKSVAALPEGQLWRHNQAGDLPGDGDEISMPDLAEIIEANKGKRGFTYTHKPVGRHGIAADNAMKVATANEYGFTVNLSANNLRHADELAALNVGPVVTVLPAEQMENTFTPEGRKVVICPAVTRDDVSCATCALCQKRDRKVIVGFPAHGAAKRKASAIASN